MTKIDPGVDKIDQSYSIGFLLFIPIYVAALLAVFVFPFAGTLRWLEGWIFIVSLTLTISIGTAIINSKNPRVLRNRSRMKKEGLSESTEKPASSDRFILPLMAIGMFGSVVTAALGHRFGWHALPLWVALIGAVLMNLGTVLLQVAQVQNAFASKVLDINQGQVLVDSGLYGRVRHPLYTGGIIMMLFLPITLGSLWGLPFALLACASLVIRIQFEEAMLLKGMPGYADYQERVKWKLFPGIY